MRKLLLGLVGVLTVSLGWVSASGAWQPRRLGGLEMIWVQCAVVDQGLTSNCRFEDYGSVPKADVPRDPVLRYLDDHPVALAGATAGSQVWVMTLLKVDRSPGSKEITIVAPVEASIRPSGAEVDDPVWILSPHNDWINQYMPDRAQRQNQKGIATARCTVTYGGFLINCWVQEEAPHDFGFGESAMLILAHSRMKPIAANGQPVGGRPYVKTFKFLGAGIDRN